MIPSSIRTAASAAPLPGRAIADPNRPVRLWLWSVYVAIVVMVLIGGITRLTGSGLSIVEWKPITGALPPLGEAAWQAEFDAYRHSPQFKIVNAWMTLSDFQRIYFWEYVHRLWGRLIGLIFLVPLVVMWARGQLSHAPRGRIVLVFALGGLQGLAGWLMVKSGLVDQPAVSHIRLAIHFLLAVTVAVFIVWILLELRPAHAHAPDAGAPAAAVPAPPPPWTGVVLLVLLALQLAYGAFMAGKHAGYLYRTWPTMNGEWMPSLAGDGPLLATLVESPIAIHAIHRTLAYVVVAVALWLAWRMRGRPTMKGARRALALAVVLQLVLGVLTVLTGVHIVLAVAHQAVGFLLASAAVWTLFELRAAR